ncbi:hypothetical protein K1719_045373 [Acacia pycnantha]|nr:hypothetical protein K1719_045373 [Acacia pycnantha]
MITPSNSSPNTLIVIFEWGTTIRIMFLNGITILPEVKPQQVIMKGSQVNSLLLRRFDDLEFIESDVSIKARGVSPVYASESEFGLDKKRKKDARLDDFVSMRKQKHRRDFQFVWLSLQKSGRKGHPGEEPPECKQQYVEHVANAQFSSEGLTLIHPVAEDRDSMAASSSSSSQVPPTKYDVFISFRGSDVRFGFLSHLRKELHEKQIDVYDDERLERGEEIVPALFEAIEGSMMSLVIFSKDFASSKWCLEELVKIMECKETNEQIVIPVFYDIDPSHVRHQTVKDILDKLEEKVPIKPKHLVGFDEIFSSVESFMKIESLEVRILGIWGMGGIGKTTLARAMFDKFSSQFESSYFVENVREESTRINGLKYLLEKILSVLLNEENLAVKGEANMFTKRRLQHKRVLLVLDDVDATNQLQYLIAENLCLGSSSRVIITSRDRHVLKSGGVHELHEVKELNNEASLKIFCLHAFKEGHPKMGYEQLSKQGVKYARGLPLALKVLGSYLNSRDVNIWESALKKFQKYPSVEIQTVLRVSYDALDEIEKCIFLDIAFFFKGQKKDDITRVLDACGFYAHCGIQNLVDKSLITISKDDIIEIHDLLQEMAEEIVREESRKHPRCRSRLNDAEEIHDVLENSLAREGTSEIEAIVLNGGKFEKPLCLSADAFQMMTNLRLLHINCEVYIPMDLKLPSKKLRYINWNHYPSESLPLGFYLEKLVEIHLENSKVKKLWDGVQDLKNLRILNLSSKVLEELPDFSRAPNLEIVSLRNCQNLCSVHPSILSLPKLVSLDLSFCFQLKSLHKIRILNLLSTRVKTLIFPNGGFNKLEELRIGGFLKSFQINKCCLTSLKVLSFGGMKEGSNNRKLGILFDSLHSLEELYLRSLVVSEIPDNISALPLLKILSLEGSSVMSLPTSIKNLSKLKQLILSRCRWLRSLLELPPSITHLDVSECISLETIEFSSTTWMLEYYEKARLSFSFENCVKLGFANRDVTEFAHFSLIRAIHNNFCGARVCYPGSTIPKWLRYTQPTSSSITIELARASSDDLLGFICCCLLPQYEIDNDESLALYKMFSCEDGEIKSMTNLVSNLSNELRMDHILLWYEPLVRTSNGTHNKREDDEGITSKFDFHFYLERYIETGLMTNIERCSIAHWCRVCPIYASECYNIVEQMELERKKGAKERGLIILMIYCFTILELK